MRISGRIGLLATISTSLVAGLAASGCGDTKVVTVTQSAATTASTAATTTTQASSGSCDAKGINRDVGNEGTCVADGVRFVVVNRAHKLRLSELAVRIVGIRQAKVLSQDVGTVRAKGRFVIFTLAVTNKLNAPVQFDSDQQTALIIGGKQFSEDFDAANGPLPDSFLWQSHDIQPTETQKGTIAYDVPLGPLPDLFKAGNLDVFNFSDAGSDSPNPIGAIRLWK